MKVPIPKPGLIFHSDRGSQYASAVVFMISSSLNIREFECPDEQIFIRSFFRNHVHIF